MNNLKKRLKDQRGLTLVELLAVIVILGIISAIAIPSIGGIIEKSRFDASKADTIQLYNAAKLLYASEGDNAITTGATATAYTNTDPGKLKDFIELKGNLTSWTVNIAAKGVVTIKAEGKGSFNTGDTALGLEGINGLTRP